jgi:hypothetical protein
VKEKKEYVIRTQGNFANLYGLGEVVAPGCAFFRDGFYDLTFSQLQDVLKKVGKAELQ